MICASPSLWFDRPFDALVHAAGKWPGNDFLEVLAQTAQVYGIQAERITYERTLAEVRTLIAAYAGAGVQPGQRVGLMLENRPAFFFHWFALNGLGVSAVPLNADWRGAELEYVIAHSEMRIAIVPPNRVADLTAAALCSEHTVVVTTDANLRGQGQAAARSSIPVASVQAECALLYTSGTTGRPKGCVLPNEYFIWAGQWYATIGHLCEVRPGLERMLTPLPTAHMNAMACSTMCMLLTGGCLVALDRFHPASWWDSVRASRATIIHYLGVMPAMLLSAPAAASDCEHEVRFGFGAGVNRAHHGAFEERFGFPLLEAWAMTETGAGAVSIANQEPRDVGTACFGRPEPAVEMRIGEETAGAPAVDEPGELRVRAAGPNPRFGFFERYLKDEAATAAAWDGGWFHTGDIVKRDARGQLHFVDRKKNVIRRSGENISAVEVEGVLTQHPLVKAIGVVGVADEVRGEEVLACIVPKRALSPEERGAAAKDILKYGLKRLAYFKLPGYLHFCEALPLTATEKIQRAELKRLAETAFSSGKVSDTRHLKKRSAVAESTPPDSGNALSQAVPVADGMKRARHGYAGVVLTTPVTVQYERYSIRSAHWWAARALDQLLNASGLAKAQVDGYCISSFSLAPDTAVGLTQHLGVSPRWLDHIPMGGAAGVVGLRRAARAVQAGDADVVACIAADTNHVESFRHTLAHFSQSAQDAVYPYGAGGPNASFAFLTAHYMEQSGATREDFGKLCVAQRTNAVRNPHALFRKPLTVQEYLDARPVAAPLHLFDCVMPCAGAEAFLVMSEERARHLKLPFVHLRGTIERHNAFPEDPIQMRGGWALDRDALYEQASIGAADMDFVQLYDDYPVMLAIQLEDLGFCAKYDAPRFIRDHTFTFDGTAPLNTGGGQLSVGQAGAAGGYVGITEALSQLTGGAGDRQVREARHGLVCGFGMINYDRGVCSGAAVLASAA